MEGAVNLRSLTIDELTGVITTYPWFGAARMELCERMSMMGGSDWGKEQYADAAMYISNRTLVSDLVRSARGRTDYSDKDLSALLKEYIAPQPAEEPKATYRRTVQVVGGDFFSSDQYEGVRQEDDNYFSRFKASRQSEEDKRNWEDPELGFCTETLAWVYAEQGYFTEAKKIYSRLMLRYPEKIAYFASLIEKLEKENKN